MKNLIKKFLIMVCKRKAHKIIVLELEVQKKLKEYPDWIIENADIKTMESTTGLVLDWFMDESIKTILIYIKTLNKQIKVIKDKLEEIVMAELGDRLTKKAEKLWSQD